MGVEAASGMMEAIRQRHSVRQFADEPLAPHECAALLRLVDGSNAESGLRFQFVSDESKAFSGVMAHYGTFRGVRNYVALVGKRADDLEERCGYFGERIVLEAQKMGLNTCWAALTYRKIPEVFTVEQGERLVAVIAVGHGLTQGKTRRSKKPESVARYIDASGREMAVGGWPEWFAQGVEASLLAPTVLNQQRFKIEGRGDDVLIKAGLGPCTNIDLGIVKYHFECGAVGHLCGFIRTAP